MTRGIRCSLIVAVFAIGGAGFLAPTAAVAQTPGTAGPITFSLFSGDGVDVNPKSAQRLVDAMRKAQAPGECPLGRLTIRAPKGDPLFQPALADARRDVVLRYLNSQGIDVSRFIVETVVSGMKGQDDVRLDLNAARDDIAPTLDVTWTPPKGSKVTVGTRITAKAVAKDDANLWQSGINTIDLNVDGGGSFGFHDYPRPQPPCANLPPPRTLDGVYTVRANPPPLVRLRAIAKDFAGNETEVWAEFPTGDWHGRIEWSTNSSTTSQTSLKTTESSHTHTGYADFNLNYDGQGNLTGTLVGSQTRQEWYGYRGERGCTATIPPTPIRARVVGSYTPGRGTLSFQFVDLDTKVTMRMRGSGRGYVCNHDSVLDQNSFLEELARRLQPAGDGIYRADWNYAHGDSKMQWSLVVRRTEN
jgi:hypothetical protein